MKKTAVLFAALLSVSTLVIPAFSQTALQRAAEAYKSAELLEGELNEKQQPDKTRAAYLKVINAYQSVYTRTPQTGYADNALMAIARLYEEINEKNAAIRTLNFLIREYPRTPFKDTAERDVERLSGKPELRTAAVENIRYWQMPDSIRIVVDLSGDITFKQGDAKSPDRVFIDVSPARLNSLLNNKQWLVKSSMLDQIRVGQYDASTVRVVLDIGNVTRVTTMSLHDPDRLIVDVFAPNGASPRPPAITSTVPATPAAPSPVAPPPPITPAASVARSASAPSAPPATTPSTPPAVASSKAPSAVPAATPAAASSTPPATASGKAPSVVPAATPAAKAPEPKVITAAKATNDGSRSLIRSLGLKLSRVVIDAGHGGHDTGSIGPTGYTEKELVLDVASRLKQLIETSLGADVVMTRTEDTFVPLETRTAIANEEQADLFVSIHANSSRVRSVRGVETFFLNFTSSREALETASRENAASERSIHELQDLVKKIMLRDKVEESRELAQHIQRSMATRKGAGTDRGVKQAPFIVLIGANMPSILAEISFISNPQEEKQIKTPAYRQAIAEALFDGVRSYAESLSGLKTAKTQEEKETEIK